MARVVRLAAAQYPIDKLASFAAFEAKLSHFVEEAAKSGAQLLLFPEYAALELTSLGGEVALDLSGSIAFLQEHLPAYDALFSKLARRHRLFIVAGSAPAGVSGPRFVNRVRLFSPEGEAGFQDKQIMTPFERDWGISPGRDGLHVFDLGIARIGIAICYDCEFPLIVRSLAEGGADIVLAPSCTDSLAGHNRVRTGCLARALENQIYTVQAPTVGDALWSAAIDINIGAAGIFAPPDIGLPDNGVIAEGELNKPGWVYADLDLDKLNEVRSRGAVRNREDWRLQPQGALGAVRTVLGEREKMPSGEVPQRR